ncbi:MAG: hypothetical protein HY785_12010 [Oscillatoriophycideae cyanobacterium NC_groundwater_1537_Pr4_S-0.65um_50_18]|nr:hypothetical protein [Oscillatoriophycideae cyanobacterium NC_groundwater_1537_Pr4_S-0.65um_50_18]
MPPPQDVQPKPPDPPEPSHSEDPSDSESQLLDDSSLNTVLDMLTVIDSAEDLALLERLTPAQKRQVWDATPEVVRTRLKQIRSARPPEALSQPPLVKHPEAESPESKPVLQPAAQPKSVSLKQGDRVVLIAKAQLTAAELQAIWEVVKVETDHVHIKTQGLSDRKYPPTWMVYYPGS